MVEARSPASTAPIALERGTGARGLRSVIEEVLEPVLLDVEAGVRYVVTEETVRGGKLARRSMSKSPAPLGLHVMRRTKIIVTS